MMIKNECEGARGRLSLQGRFDFHSHRDFRSAYETMFENSAVRELEIDFGQVDYLDSSALGMLLLLKEKSESSGRAVVLSGLQGTVKQVLDIANFGKLFNIRA